MKIVLLFFYTALIFFPLLFSSCHQQAKTNSPQHDLSKIKKGMSFTEVLELAGFPDQKINVGSVTDEFGYQTKTEEWHYGDNQMVVIVNDTVNSIDLDIRSTQEKIRHIIDSAKAAGDTSSMIQSIQ